MKRRILLADDHKILRDGLRVLLETQMGNTVVGEAENGREAVRLVRKLKPEIVIMDISMPDMNGIEATQKILKEHPEVKIIALSMYSDKRFVVDMLRAGASAYLLKDCAFEELEEAIDTVSRNRKYVSPNVTGVVLDDYVEKLKQPQRPSPFLLSDREREVLARLAEGESTKQIALELGVSTKTIETQRARIIEKLDIHTLADLIKYAIREGITTLGK